MKIELIKYSGGFMKNILLVLVMLCLSPQLYAGRGKEILNKYLESELVKKSVRDVENLYGVVCKAGVARGIFPTVFGSVKYLTTCDKFGTKLSVKISSSFKNDKEPDFSLERIRVMVLFGDANSTTDDLQVRTLDPFVDAFKKSSLVRELKHFVENEYKVVCKIGRASRGNLFNREKYFYNVKCKNGEQSLRLKIASKVQIIGEDVFRFKLSNYKIIF
jgi:hypothetical protein